MMENITENMEHEANIRGGGKTFHVVVALTTTLFQIDPGYLI
jgi:hypothetical protein